MPAPPEPPDSVTFAQFTGLRNNVTPERLAPTDLERATNVDLDDAGQPRRRRGFTQKSSITSHSLFTAVRGTLVVRGGDLGWLRDDFSFALLRAGVGPDRVAYVEVGDDIYFSSSGYSGIIRENDAVDPWGAVTSAGNWESPVLAPTATLGQVRGKLLGAPPLATDLALHNGRVYLASGPTVWATELYQYSYVDKTRNFLQFESEVTMLAAVNDGLFVGTKTKTWYLSGAFGQMKRDEAAATGVFPGSKAYIPRESINLQNQGVSAASKTAVVFMGGMGIFAGVDGGACFNLTNDKLWFPAATSAAAMFRRQDGMNQYIAATDSAGTPSAAARIGDYVEAEIRRF